MAWHQPGRIASLQLAAILNRSQPSDDPAGWQISETGTVWTEIVANTGTGRECRTQVVAISSALFLLVLSSSNPDGFEEVEDFPTLRGARNYWRGRNQ